LRDAVLLPLHDRGVRDGEPHGPAEERGHGEPVGERADHGGLGHRPEPAEPRVARFEDARGDEEGRDQQEEPGRDALHPVETLLPEGGVLDLRDGDAVHAGKKHRGLPGRHPRGRTPAGEPVRPDFPRQVE
jgi:hypothetical protein